MPNSKVKMTTVLPFVVNTGMAYEPRSRFRWLVPIVEPEECAGLAIDAMLKEEEDVFVPSVIRLSIFSSKCLPRRFQLAVLDFMDIFMGYRPDH